MVFIRYPLIRHLLIRHFLSSSSYNFFFSRPTLYVWLLFISSLFYFGCRLSFTVSTVRHSKEYRESAAVTQHQLGEAETKRVGGGVGAIDFRQ